MKRRRRRRDARRSRRGRDSSLARGGWSELETSILLALIEPSSHAMKSTALASALGLSLDKYQSFERVLGEMERKGAIKRVRAGGYEISKRLELVSGTISITRKGHGFVRTSDGEDDVYVPGHDLQTAIHGDAVFVQIEHRPRGRNREGTVIRVLKRRRKTFVGIYQRVHRTAVVTTLYDRVPMNIRVRNGGEIGASEGQIVVVEVLSFGQGRREPNGQIKKVLGNRDDPETQVLAIAHAHGLPQEFNDELLAEAKLAAAQGSLHPGDHRVDLTSLLTFTIDPADAKDHDDALSVEYLGHDRVRVGIHIADVSHFVPLGSPVDVEASARGTSVYLVDRTIPMLPPVLANDVCSLNPGARRFALSVFVTLDSAGQIHEHRYQHTIIKCRVALSYETTQEVLEGNSSGDPEIDEALYVLRDHARAVRALRGSRGALDFDLPETEVLLDPSGEPLEIRRRERLEAHRLIEDFMILANELVAGDLEELELLGLYRVHEPPAPQKVDNLSDTLAQLGLALPSGQLSPSDLQKILLWAEGRAEESLVNTMVLRSLRRARYCTENLGHFGLGSPGYSHFTSPIRRYPDLVVHRVVSRCLVDGEENLYQDLESLRELAEQCSIREQAAVEAERESVALKRAAYMERHVGEEYSGQITGVAPFGIFVTLDTLFVEGLIHIRTVVDDYYHFDEHQHALVGERGHQRFSLGDAVLVKVARVDRDERRIEFTLLKKLSSGPVIRAFS